MHDTYMIPDTSLKPEGTASRFLGLSFLAFLWVEKTRRCDLQAKKMWFSDNWDEAKSQPQCSKPC